MAILVFDIGGSSVKYGVWNKDQLMDKGKFTTPETWDEMKEQLAAVKEKAARHYSLEGVALSAPGAVNQETKQIEGISAVKYLHFFPIYDELEDLFALPVAIENDANSAALAEVWKGSARENDTVLFVVIGTGIGGAVIVNKKVHHGPHLFGGEFGYMVLNEGKTFSELGTAVKMARRYAERKGLAYEAIDGKQVFELAEKGDPVAIEEVDTFYSFLIMGLYNLAYSFDPEKIIIGGGVSSMNGLIERLNQEFDRFLKQINHHTFRPDLEVCTFRNDANLIGAVYNFIQKNKDTDD
ncbi:Sugar kinase of the NBD/HSP70 family, may contain an N-terminal HTH domain [Alkalibacterium subtropicum]|uniref:Sugar kinase of the NBD/HSP70 family, may contain an N-terminal HTH domain n=1 Tax=Alkalibacterium subtropicum TaxID=753702 RepID=A0A1I1HTM8_9LACT|nr:ROK family protein [Alkalibacterium subtropicum]SFC27274.1 Sugar kinase of the NBD/HSP70 family, may contain an N-terminal HTH domain [Alkalibacterium subtropicum]